MSRPRSAPRPGAGPCAPPRHACSCAAGPWWQGQERAIPVRSVPARACIPVGDGRAPQSAIACAVAPLATKVCGDHRFLLVAGNALARPDGPRELVGLGWRVGVRARPAPPGLPAGSVLPERLRVPLLASEPWSPGSAATPREQLQNSFGRLAHPASPADTVANERRYAGILCSAAQLLAGIRPHPSGVAAVGFDCLPWPR